MAARNLSAGLMDPDVMIEMRAILADLVALKVAYAVLTAKLDADTGVTDTNYTTLCAPPAANIVP